MPDESLRFDLPGGAVPEPVALLQETWAEFSDDLGPYLLAGLGQLCVMLPVILTLFVFIYFGIFATVFGGMIAGVFAGALISEALGPDAGALAFFFTYLLTLALMLLLIVGISAAVGAVMAPMNASLTRRIAEHQRGQRPLDFTAAFSDMGQDLAKVVLLAVLTSTIVFVGILFCYLPGLIAAFLMIYAGTFVYLHRLSPVDAIRASVDHFRAHLEFHAMFTLLYFCCAMFASYVPVVGPMFIAALHVRAHRTLFGDADEPVFS